MSYNLENFAGLTFDQSSPLNQAYLKETRAEDLASLGNYDTAIELLQDANALLNQARGLTNHPKSKELIDAQINRNLYQIDSYHKCIQFKIKEQQLEEERKRQMMNYRKISVNANAQSENDDPSKLETRIFRAMEQQDSLLEILIQKHDPSLEASSAPVSPKTSHVAYHKPCDKTQIEELKLRNQYLKALVMKLIDELDEEKLKNSSLEKELERIKSEEKNASRDTSSLPPYLNDSLDAPKLLY